jgi:hypothetical protein
LKKRVLISAASAVIIIIGCAITPLAAQETDETALEKKPGRPRFSMGINFWYTWWNPAWQKTRVNSILPLGNINPKIVSTLIFGVTAAIRLNDNWSLATSINYGEFGVSVRKFWPVPVPYRPTYETKAQRIDADVTAGYAINPYVTFFAGGKYQGSIVSMRYLRQYNFRPNYAGPAAGFIFNIPIVAKISFVPVVTGILMGGKEHSGPSAVAGCGLSGSIVYLAMPSGISVSIGGRYQYLAYITPRDPYYHGDSDQLFGAIVTLMYSF